MSVSFNRAQLVRVAEAALAEHVKAQVSYQAAVDKYKAQHAKDHGGKSRDRCRELRDQLTKALKKPGPIKRTDVALFGGYYRVDEFCYSEPDSYRGRYETVTKPDGLLTPAQVTETKALLQVLKTAVGTEVTANELKLLGLKLLGLKNLGPVFTAAAAEAAQGVGK